MVPITSSVFSTSKKLRIPMLYKTFQSKKINFPISITIIPNHSPKRKSNLILIIYAEILSKVLEKVISAFY